MLWRQIRTCCCCRLGSLWLSRRDYCRVCCRCAGRLDESPLSPDCASHHQADSRSGKPSRGRRRRHHHRAARGVQPASIAGNITIVGPAAPLKAAACTAATMTIAYSWESDSQGGFVGSRRCQSTRSAFILIWNRFDFHWESLLICPGASVCLFADTRRYRRLSPPVGLLIGQRSKLRARARAHIELTQFFPSWLLLLLSQ